MSNKEDSKAWIERCAQNCDGLSYDELMSAAINFVVNEEYLIEGGRFEGMNVPDEFWEHFEAVTGQRVPEDRKRGFFSCSC